MGALRTRGQCTWGCVYGQTRRCTQTEDPYSAWGCFLSWRLQTRFQDVVMEKGGALFKNRRVSPLLSGSVGVFKPWLPGWDDAVHCWVQSSWDESQQRFSVCAILQYQTTAWMQYLLGYYISSVTLDILIICFSRRMDSEHMFLMAKTQGERLKP